MHKASNRQELDTIPSTLDLNPPQGQQTIPSILKKRRTTILHSDANLQRKSKIANDDAASNAISDLKRNADALLKIDEDGARGIKFVKHAEGVLQCQCKVCEIDNMHIKEEIKPLPVGAFFQGFDFNQCLRDQDLEKDFVFVLKKLVPPRELPYTLRIFIPETIAFADGEAKFIVLTEKDKKLRFVQNRDRLTIPEVRKFFQEYQKRKENELIMYDEMQKVTNMMEAGSRGEISTAEAGSRSSMARTKSVRTRLVMNAATSGRSLEKEVGIIKYKDDTASVMNEVEINSILLKRKNDLFWRSIQYIQLYVRTKRGIQNMQRVYFVYERDKTDPLFERSLFEIKYLNGDIPKASQDYIPIHEEEVFEEQLRKTDLNKFYLYLLMKVYHFVEVFWGVRITKMGGDFIKDHMDVVWLVNISRLQYEVLPNPVKKVRENILDTMRITESSEKDEQQPENQKQIKTKSKGVGKHEALKAMHGMLKGEYDQLKQNMGMVIKSEEDDGPMEEPIPQFYMATPQKNVQATRRETVDKVKGDGTFSPPKSFNTSRKVSCNSSGLNCSIKVMKPGRMSVASIDKEAKPTARMLFLKKGQEFEREGDPIRRSINLDLSGIQGSKKDLLQNINDQSSRALTSRREIPSQIKLSRNVTSLKLLNNLGEESLWENTNRNLPEIQKEGKMKKLNAMISVENHRHDDLLNLKSEDSRKLEGTKSLTKIAHTQWVKDFNNKIKQRVSIQLSGRFSPSPRGEIHI